MLVVTDASPVVFLSRLGLFELLRELYGRIVIPQAVFDEVVTKGTGLPGSQELSSAKWADRANHDPDAVLSRSLGGELGAGEVAAIAIALSLGADLVLMDDRQGRLTAERLGLVVKGTLGVLVTAKRQGLLTELRPILDRLVEQGAWFSPSLRQAVLRSVGEE